MRDPSPTPSPCINVCRLNDATGLCDGCLRSLSEIARWASLDEAERRAVVAAVERRKRDPQLQATARQQGD